MPEQPADSKKSHGQKKRASGRAPLFHKICDGCTEGVLYGSILFGTWAYASAERWSTSVLSLVGCFLGLLLLFKWISRWITGYRPLRPTVFEPRSSAENRAQATGRKWVMTLAIVTVSVIAWHLCAFLNARAQFSPLANVFAYFDCISWLPHSYDKWSTRRSLISVFGLACFFWSTWDWLSTVTTNRRKENAGSTRERSGEVPPILPAKLNRLCWAIALNALVLAIEGHLQRLSGTNRLLFLSEPYWNKTPESQFGPYAYRSNAAQYFNLVWPLVLGLWMCAKASTRRAQAVYRAGGGAHVFLGGCVILLAATPILTLSRAGALITLVSLPIAIRLVSVSEAQGRKWSWDVAGLGLAVLILATYFAATGLQKRFETVLTDNMSGRTLIYKYAVQIFSDYKWLGSGPGSFGSMYYLVRSNPTDEWEAYAHNDWLESLVTLGIIGSAILWSGLIPIFAKWRTGAGSGVPRTFVWLVILSLSTCLVHAVGDMPFQVYSISHLFILLSAILFAIAPGSGGQPLPERPGPP